MVTKPVSFGAHWKFSKAGEAETYFRSILNTGEMRNLSISAEN